MEQKPTSKVVPILIGVVVVVGVAIFAMTGGGKGMQGLIQLRNSAVLTTDSIPGYSRLQVSLNDWIPHTLTATLNGASSTLGGHFPYKITNNVGMDIMKTTLCPSKNSPNPVVNLILDGKTTMPIVVTQTPPISCAPSLPPAISLGTLNVALASNPVSKSVIKGTSAVQFNGLTFTCGVVSNCKVTDLTLNGVTSSGNANTYVGSAKLVLNGTDFTSYKAVSSNGSVNFNNLNWIIQAGQTSTLIVAGDISSTAPVGGSIYFKANVPTDIVAMDGNGVSITPTGKANSDGAVKINVK